MKRIKITGCRALFIALIVLGCWGRAIGGEAPGRIPVPDWLEGIAVAETLVINGLPSVVHNFQVERPMDDVLAYYRERWRDPSDGSTRQNGYKEVKAGIWTVISRLEDKRYLLTVQVKSTGTFTSVGYLAEGDLKRMATKASVRADVPKMQGSRIVNDVTSHDPGKTGRTLIVINDYSARSNSDFYRNYYSDRNWSKLIDFPQENGHVLAYGKGGQEAHLVISERYNTTQVVMNLIESN